MKLSFSGKRKEKLCVKLSIYNLCFNVRQQIQKVLINRGRKGKIHKIDNKKF